MPETQTLAPAGRSPLYETTAAEAARVERYEPPGGEALYEIRDSWEPSPREANAEFTYNVDARVRFAVELERAPAANDSPVRFSALAEPLSPETDVAPAPENARGEEEYASYERALEYSPPRRFEELENRISADRFERAIREIETNPTPEERRTENIEEPPEERPAGVPGAGERDLPVSLDVFA